MGQLVGHQAVIVWAGPRAEKDIAASGERLRADAAVELVRLRAGVHANILEASTKLLLHCWRMPLPRRRPGWR